MYHMVCGSLPTAAPTAEHLLDQLSTLAPTEYNSLAVALANEKPIERLSVVDALRDFDKVTVPYGS